MKGNKKKVYGAMIKTALGKVFISTDKLNQVCEISPIADWNRPILSWFRGRPFSLCNDELIDDLKQTAKKNSSK